MYFIQEVNVPALVHRHRHVQLASTQQKECPPVKIAQLDISAQLPAPCQSLANLVKSNPVMEPAVILAQAMKTVRIQQPQPHVLALSLLRTTLAAQTAQLVTVAQEPLL